MKNRSRVFDFFCVLLLASALSLPIHGYLNSEIFGGSEGRVHPFKITATTYLWMALCAFAAFLAWRASHWLLYFGPVGVAGVAWKHFEIAGAGDYSPFTLLAGSAGVSSIFALCFLGSIREVLFNPRKRWWLTSPRRRVQIRAMLRTWTNDSVIGHTEDISSGGVFLVVDPEKHPELLYSPKIEVGKMIHLKFEISPLSILRVQAQIVRKAYDHSLPYRGLGLRFVNLNTFEQRRINELLS